MRFPRDCHACRHHATSPDVCATFQQSDGTCSIVYSTSCWHRQEFAGMTKEQQKQANEKVMAIVEKEKERNPFV